MSLASRAISASARRSARYSGVSTTSLVVRTSRRHAAIAVLLIATTGCTTFGPVPAQYFVAAKRPPQVWVTEVDGRVEVLERPSFAGDTLTGFVDNHFRQLAPDRIRLVNARRAAPGRTAALVIGAVAVVGVGAVLVRNNGSCTPVGPAGFDQSLIC